jgi:hypothetical protein
MPRKKNKGHDQQNDTTSNNNNNNNNMKLTARADEAASTPKHKKSWRKAVSSDTDDSAVSDLSTTTSGDDETDGDGNLEEDRTFDKSEDYELFEKSLRTKHSKACKAMSVRKLSCFLFREITSLLFIHTVSHVCTFFS